ncbi:hypothetical protein D039_0093A, partial [Vibrio parahaemolyticus EKP-028]
MYKKASLLKRNST